MPTNALLLNRVIYKHVVILLHVSAFFCRHQGGIKQQNTRITECDLEDKLQTYNKINGAIGRHFGKK